MPIVFVSLLVSSCLYALIRGGAPERVAACLLVSATAASAITLTLSSERYLQTEVLTMWVDVLLALGFVALALRAQRYWPMWIAMIHIDIVAFHLIMFSSETGPLSYWMMQAAWSYPAPIVLAVGTYRHRLRLARYGDDLPWS